MWVDSEEEWLRSTIVQQAEFTSKTKFSGDEQYVTFKELVQRHGQENAEKLRDTKKAAQLNGPAYEDVPWWFQHPDFPDLEVSRWICSALMFTCTVYTLTHAVVL